MLLKKSSFIAAQAIVKLRSTYLCFTLSVLISTQSMLATTDIEMCGSQTNVTAVNSGDSIVVSYCMKIGPNPTNGAKTRVYLSEDQAISPSDIILATWEELEFTSFPNGITIIGDVNGNEYSLSIGSNSITFSRNLTIPSSGVSAGSYYVIVEADALAQFNETNETNNLSLSEISIGQDLPDLVPFDARHINPDLFFKLTSATTQWENEITLSAIYANQGTVAVSEVPIGVYLSEDANIEQSDLLLNLITATHSNGEFPAGSAFSSTLTATLPENPHPNSPDKLYYIGFILDPNDSIAESIESNNTGLGDKIDILGPIEIDEVYPDFRGWNGGTSNPDYRFDVLSTLNTWEGNLNLRFVVANFGNKAADQVKIGLYLSLDENIDASEDILIEHLDVDRPDGFQVNQASFFTREFSLPANPFPGEITTDLYIGIVFDPLGEVVELDESNNRNIGEGVDLTGPITISNSGPVLTITDSSLPGNDRLIDFGEVYNDGPGRAQSGEQLIELKKLGDGPLTIGSLMLLDNTNFVITEALYTDGDTPAVFQPISLPLAAGITLQNNFEYILLKVLFDPTVDGTSSSTLSIENTSGGSLGEVTLTGVGLFLADSDYDNLPDNLEIKYFGNLEQDGTGDFDDDTVSNSLEIENGTDPSVSNLYAVKTIYDLNNNGYSDAYEQFYGFDGDLFPHYEDFDGDSILNIEEFFFGTNILVADVSKFRTQVYPDRNRFGFWGVPGIAYQLETSSDLKDWHIDSIIYAASGYQEIDLPEIGETGFFRLRPIHVDRDGGGLSDYEESLIGSDSLQLADQDLNDIPDEFQIVAGGGLSADERSDDDGDSILLRDEWRYRLNPTLDDSQINGTTYEYEYDRLVKANQLELIYDKAGNPVVIQISE